MSSRTNSRWYRQQVAEHEAELAKPQRFPLTDDGDQTREAIGWAAKPKPASGEKLKTARYRDWQRSRKP
jgi:hypothetical protein